jgi:hypothetical protein
MMAHVVAPALGVDVESHQREWQGVDCATVNLSEDGVEDVTTPASGSKTPSAFRTVGFASSIADLVDAAVRLQRRLRS